MQLHEKILLCISLWFVGSLLLGIIVGKILSKLTTETNYEDFRGLAVRGTMLAHRTTQNSNLSFDPFLAAGDVAVILGDRPLVEVILP